MEVETKARDPGEAVEAWVLDRQLRRGRRAKEEQEGGRQVDRSRRGREGRTPRRDQRLVVLRRRQDL